MYLSTYFETRRDQYYETLQRVRERGAFDDWLALFLDAVRVQAIDALLRAERLLDLRERYRERVQAETRGAANQAVDLAFAQPVLTARVVERALGVTRPAALKALRQLEDVGVIVEVAGGPRRQLRWQAHEILAILTDDS